MAHSPVASPGAMSPRASRPHLQVPQGLRPSLKFTLATAAGSPSPLHEFCTLTPCPRQTVSSGARRLALILSPLLGTGLSLSSGLQTSSAVSGLVTLRVSSSGYFASFIPAYPATNLSLSLGGAQGPCRTCHVLVQWSLVTCVLALPSLITQALTCFPCFLAPHPPFLALSPVAAYCLLFADSACPLICWLPSLPQNPTHQDPGVGRTFWPLIHPCLLLPYFSQALCPWVRAGMRVVSAAVARRKVWTWRDIVPFSERRWGPVNLTSPPNQGRRAGTLFHREVVWEFQEGCKPSMLG